MGAREKTFLWFGVSEKKIRMAALLICAHLENLGYVPESSSSPYLVVTRVGAVQGYI